MLWKGAKDHHDAGHQKPKMAVSPPLLIRKRGRLPSSFFKDERYLQYGDVVKTYIRDRLIHNHHVGVKHFGSHPE